MSYIKYDKDLGNQLINDVSLSVTTLSTILKNIGEFCTKAKSVPMNKIVNKDGNDNSEINYQVEFKEFNNVIGNIENYNNEIQKGTKIKLESISEVLSKVHKMIMQYEDTKVLDVSEIAYQQTSSTTFVVREKAISSKRFVDENGNVVDMGEKVNAQYTNSDVSTVKSVSEQLNLEMSEFKTTNQASVDGKIDEAYVVTEQNIVSNVEVNNDMVVDSQYQEMEQQQFETLEDNVIIEERSDIIGQTQQMIANNDMSQVESRLTQYGYTQPEIREIVKNEDSILSAMIEGNYRQQVDDMSGQMMNDSVNVVNQNAAVTIANQEAIKNLKKEIQVEEVINPLDIVSVSSKNNSKSDNELLKIINNG